MSRNALEFGEQAALFVSIGAMDVILQLLGDLWQFALDHSEVAIFIATGGLGFLGWLMPKAWRSLRRSPEKPLLTDNFPFECIPPGSHDLVQQVLDSAQDKADPLADFNIPYQSRQTDQDVQQFLEQRLARKRWLLILGHKGLGKTREMAELARIYSQEGWFVLRLKNQESGLLTEPARFPEEQIGMSQPKLLFVLDNLNQAMFLGKRRSTLADAASEQDGQRLAQALDRPFHDRLLKTLQFYENTCGNDRIRVIATARNEPGELEKLELDQHLDFWNRFEQYELLPPSDQAIVNLLSDRTTEAKIATNPSEFASFARSNDGTFRNIVENLIKVKNRGLSLTAQTFEHSLDGTWEERYHTAIETYPIADLIYDAVDLLRQMGITLHDFTVLPTAQLLMGENCWQRFRRKRKLKQALDYLTQNERILQPRDGQIEAKGNQVEADPYIPALLNLLLNWVDRHPQAIQDSLLSFGIEAAKRNYHQEALISFDRLLKLTPDSAIAWFWKGYSMSELGQKQEAIVFYDRAIQHKPDLYQAWVNHGNALSDLGRQEEAILSYDKAISLSPEDYIAWYNRGNALSALAQKQEALDSYDKALNLKPDFYEAWHNRGGALSNLGLYLEAIESYNKALKIKPDDSQSWIGKGNALKSLKHYEKAVESYEEALKIEPDNYKIWNNLGTVLSGLERYKEAIDRYNRAIQLNPESSTIWHSRSSTLYQLGDYAKALADCDRAIQLNSGDGTTWVLRGMILAALGQYEEADNSYSHAYHRNCWDFLGNALCNFGCYDEAVRIYNYALQVEPDDDTIWYFRGLALYKLKHYEEAIKSFDKSLEFSPRSFQELYMKSCCY